MMMGKSQAQQTSSPLFLDDEETDLGDTLPFDRCIKADEEFEEDLEAKEVQIDVQEFLRELSKIKTTPFKSKGEILSWVGIKNILLWIGNKFIIPIVGVSVSVVILFAVIFYSLNLHGVILECVMASAFVFFIFASAFFWAWGSDVSSVEYIYRKLDSDDYLISNHVVDCPATVKIKLNEYIKFEKELYIRYVPQKQELQFFTNGGKVSYYTLEKSSDKNDFEYHMNYFANQLIPNKFYLISDIITDKAPRNKNKGLK